MKCYYLLQPNDMKSMAAGYSKVVSNPVPVPTFRW